MLTAISSGVTRPDVQPRGCLNPVESPGGNAAALERLADRGEPLRARHDPEVGGLHRESGFDHVFVRVAHRRDDGERARTGGRLELASVRREAIRFRKRRALRRRIRNVDRVPHGLCQARQGAHDRRDAEENQARTGEDRLQIDFHASSAMARHGKWNDPGTLIGRGIGGKRNETRLSVGERALGFSKDRGLRAASPEPAAKLSRRGDHSAVSRLRGARRLSAHDGGDHERLFAPDQIRREDQNVVAHQDLPAPRRSFAPS